MTGIYFRAERNGKWENVELEDLTPEERHMYLDNFSNESLLKTIDLLCNILSNIKVLTGEN